ncbi:MAG: hypothetical protein U9R44_07265 [Candidatus Omnitrophota bacterium]|nr:hypothetical protein [Candidatus Omnitrophota bacterium]
MGILEAIKKGFVQATKLMNVVLVFFVFNVVIGLISLPLVNPERAGNPGIIAVSVVSSILFFLIFIFLQGGALGTVRDQVKTATASMAQFTEYGKKFYLRILGLLLLYILIAIGVVLVLSLISAGLLLLGDNIVIRSIVATIVTVAAIVVITLLVYPIYSIVVEDIGALAALKRGVVVAKSNFWRTLGLFVMMLLVSLVISLIIGFIIGLISVPLPVNISQIVVAIVNAAVQSYIPIVMMVAFMGFYMSLTEAKEAQEPPPQQESSV